MLNYLVNTVLYPTFTFVNYKNILEFVPSDNRHIHEYTYDESIQLIKTIKDFCIKIVDKKFIVSLSGGVDSMVLISIIKYLGYKVIAGHINYNNRNETTEEQKFLEEWCNYNKIKLYVKSINNIKRANSKRSDYEIITKNMRLDFYKTIMVKENVNTILLAHHKDDIVENIFANVCRGRYILDLAVIKENSIVSNINIARPMISFYKDSICDFAYVYQVPYFKDTTPDWSVRGKYRKLIYPVIEDTFTKNVKNNLIGLSNQSFEWNELITQEIIKPFMNKVIFIFNDYENIVQFNIANYINYPLCFWNVVFMNIFNQFGHNCPSRKGIQTFMRSIKRFSTHNYNISISNNCKSNIKNNMVTIVFKVNN